MSRDQPSRRRDHSDDYVNDENKNLSETHSWPEGNLKPIGAKFIAGLFYVGIYGYIQV